MNHPKMKILSSFSYTHTQVVPNMYAFHPLVEFWKSKSWWTPLTSWYFSPHAMEGNEDHQLFGYKYRIFFKIVLD